MIVTKMSVQGRNTILRDSSLEMVEDRHRAVELNAGIFIWPMILSASMTIGLLFGYLVWGG
jgi:hypothetical protein